MILVKGRDHVLPGNFMYQESAVAMLSIQRPSNTAAVILRTLKKAWNTKYRAFEYR